MPRLPKTLLTLLLAPALILSAGAQTATAPATPATTAKPAVKPKTATTTAPKAATAAKTASTTTVRKPATAASRAAAAKKAADAALLAEQPKLPAGIPPVTAPVVTPLSLRYQDILVGTGEAGQSGKLFSVLYTGWLAADGKKFDSSADHLDANKKEQPLKFMQGVGRMIPGFDYGVAGMHIGGKRRIFIPAQLAYGARGAGNVIPPNSDLIFDVELVNVEDAPKPPAPPAKPAAAPTPAPKPADATKPAASNTTPATTAKPAATATPATAPAPAPAAKPAATPAPAASTTSTQPK